MHSHPWKDPYFTATQQSKADAKIQEEQGLTLSLIINLWSPEKKKICWWLSCWLVGFSAPLRIYIKKDNKHYTTNQWFTKSKYRNKFPWSHAFACP